MLIAARTQLLVWMSRTGSPAPERALEILDEAIDCARSLSYDVSPPVRASAGLADELTWLAHWFRDRHGFTVTIESPPRTMDIPDAERLFLMQSLRELILNAAKYAGVEEARVDVRGTRSGVSVEVTDEGRGFDPAAIDLRERVSNGHGFGLLNIRERARALGGRLDLVSAPGQGTRATIFLPFEGLAEPAAEADDRQHSLL
jgi:signal transduction histidine kinase